MKDLWRDIASGEVLVSLYEGSDTCRSTGGSLFQRGGTRVLVVGGVGGVQPP